MSLIDLLTSSTYVVAQRVAKNITGNQADAEDAIQDACVGILEAKVENVNPSYFIVAVRNAAFKIKRGQGDTYYVDDEPLDYNSPDLLAELEELNSVEEILDLIDKHKSTFYRNI